MLIDAPDNIKILAFIEFSRKQHAGIHQPLIVLRGKNPGIWGAWTAPIDLSHRAFCAALRGGKVINSAPKFGVVRNGLHKTFVRAGRIFCKFLDYLLLCQKIGRKIMGDAEPLGTLAKGKLAFFHPVYTKPFLQGQQQLGVKSAHRIAPRVFYVKHNIFNVHLFKKRPSGQEGIAYIIVITHSIQKGGLLY